MVNSIQKFFIMLLVLVIVVLLLTFPSSSYSFLPLLLYIGVGFVLVLLLVFQPKKYFFMKKPFFSLLFALLIVLVLVSLTAFFSRPFAEQSLMYEFSVDSFVGLTTNTSSVHFGTAMPDATLEKSILLTTKKPAVVKLSWEGDGDLSSDKNHFHIDEKENVSLTLHIPPDMLSGNYSGVIMVNFFRS